MVVYVKTQGARIIKEGKHLLVKKGDATYHTLFTYKLKQFFFSEISKSLTALYVKSCATILIPCFLPGMADIGIDLTYEGIATDRRGTMHRAPTNSKRIHW